MSEFHFAYLSLGSNIEPEVNLPKAVQLLSQHGEIQKASSVWESKPVGTTGANYLNICLLFRSIFLINELKEKVIHPVELQLGRKRSDDKFAPRTIDIDVLIFNEQIIGADWLALAYAVVPLAEIHPEFQNPLTKETIAEIATRLRQSVWLETRRGILHRPAGFSE
jgi:2-amino-4-hydroxy-6-hydroxymethyldihydropteridine diphosphokinase